MYRRAHHSPTLWRIAPVTFALLVVNVAVYTCVALFVPDIGPLYMTWGLVPAHLTLHTDVTSLLSIVTSMFLHGGYLHLIMNMLMLYFLGRMVEHSLGARRFVLLYFISGLTAALLQVTTDPVSLVPMVGASGAISGLLGAAVVMAPRQQVMVITPLTLFIPIKLKMKTLGYVWLALQIAPMVFTDPLGGGVAYAAHLGGFIGGYWFLRLLVRSVSARRSRRPGRPRAASAVAQPSSARPGPAPDEHSRTYWVIDANGVVHTFHEPRADPG